ncbi:hypothetical protein LHEH8_03350 [Lactobacillus helveticus]|uniref:Transposase DDE domain-containing protein n=1 Tax=Lactobacillus helveticus TaxID=1587 RepID=A0A8H9F6T6_LACHE|nr:hypothetical protein LHEH8_03350 [Lactobacillus helveticus]GFP01054.1 hypothetical protein LHEW6_08870 [Lactobacillus helveticus]GFP03352.1 hypothetical protein LHEY10_12810 [Lactobacillus helveticus]
MNQKVDLSGQFLIIDSFPVPVCQPVRNYRLRIFRGSANIGYKATKKIYYYGFKVHAIVGDEGYLGKRLHDQLKQMGYELWTPYRKNMAGAKKHNDRQLMAIRRTMKATFHF